MTTCIILLDSHNKWVIKAVAFKQGSVGATEQVKSCTVRKLQKNEMTRSRLHSLWILFFRKSFCLELQNALVEIAVRLVESVTGKSERETE